MFRFFLVFVFLKKDTLHTAPLLFTNSAISSMVEHPETFKGSQSSILWWHMFFYAMELHSFFM